MAKTGRHTGPSNADGTPPRLVDTHAGRHLELLGTSSTLHLGGDLTIDGDLTVAGTASVGPAATAEIDSATITENITGIALSNALLLVAVTGLTVTVGDLAQPVYVDAEIVVQCGTADSSASLVIAPVGSTLITQALVGQTIRVTAANSPEGVYAKTRLAASSPGEYGVFLSGPSGTWTVVAATYGPGLMTALAV